MVYINGAMAVPWLMIIKPPNIIKIIDTEKNLILHREIKYFCDNIHQTHSGNKKTAKIIYEYLKKN